MKKTLIAALICSASVVGVTAGTAGATKRDVVGDAVAICAAASSEPNLQAACGLLADTQNEEVTTFSGKPQAGAQNLEAQSRAAASVVLSHDDLYARNKVAQIQTAIDYACKYAAKSDALVDAGKVSYADGRDLGQDAQDLAASIYDQFAGAYEITNSCA